MPVGKEVTININPSLRLKWDDIVISLEKRKTRENRFVYWKTEAWYSSISQACVSLLENHFADLTERNVYDIKELKSVMYDCVKMIKESL